MTPHTVKHLRDVEDRAPALGVDALQQVRHAAGDLDAERTGLSLMGLRPGRRQAVAHRHVDAEEIYVVVAGSGRIKLGEEVRAVRPMDAVRIAPGVLRALEAGPEGLEYLAFGPRHPGDGETVPIDEFWPG